jgi:hypothetical protein
VLDQKRRNSQLKTVDSAATLPNKVFKKPKKPRVKASQNSKIIIFKPKQSAIHQRHNHNIQLKLSKNVLKL